MLRWIARIATLVGIFFLMGFFSEGGFPSTNWKEWLLFLFFPISTLSGYILSWMYDRTGAAVSLLSIFLFYIIHLILEGAFPLGTSFALYGIPPVLFLVARMFESNSDKAK